MSPLYVVDLLTALEIASASDPTTAAAIRRLNVAIRASGYTEQTLVDAAVEELEERLGKDCVIAEDH
jgi:hypothetical protein